jgi:hypothetical protein
MTKWTVTVLAILVFTVMFVCGRGEASKEMETKFDFSKRVGDIEKRVAQFAPIQVKVDTAFLTKTQKKVLGKLVEASKLIDELYMNQVWSQNEKFKKSLSKEKKLDRNFMAYFDIMYGPFDRKEENKPFIGGVEKPKGANFYPPDMTKDEFEKWIKDHPADKTAFESWFTVIKREGDKLVAVPYSKEYAKWLVPASKLLKDAAKITENESLRKFLNSRADAFLSDNYYQSDIDWMDVKDSPIDLTIGPYEVYEDDLFNYKAAFESFVNIVNPAESKKLEIYQSYLKELDQNLPLDQKYKAKREKYESPIRVAEVYYAAGDAKRGIQTIAYNLPNDEKVREAKGNKQVMLKNRIEAKYKGILSKIAEEVLDKDQVKYVTGDAFFLEILHHELAHSLGPASSNKALKDKYSAFEETKADVAAIYNILYLVDKGVIAKNIANEVLPTYLAGIFRAIRFGSDAHGIGMVMQFNYLMNKGAVAYDKATGKFRINFDKVRPAITDLTRDILTIHATGDYEKASSMMANLGKTPFEVENAIAKLTNIPVDIKPVYAVK